MSITLFFFGCEPNGGGTTVTNDQPILGCTDPLAINYIKEADTDDGSCLSFVGKWTFTSCVFSFLTDDDPAERIELDIMNIDDILVQNTKIEFTESGLFEILIGYIENGNSDSLRFKGDWSLIGNGKILLNHRENEFYDESIIVDEIFSYNFNGSKELELENIVTPTFFKKMKILR